MSNEDSHRCPRAKETHINRGNMTSITRVVSERLKGGRWKAKCVAQAGKRETHGAKIRQIKALSAANKGITRVDQVSLPESEGAVR